MAYRKLYTFIIQTLKHDCCTQYAYWNLALIQHIEVQNLPQQILNQIMINLWESLGA